MSVSGPLPAEQPQAQEPPVCVRAATPDDIPVLMHLKRQLAIAEGYEAVVCATKQDWRRDAFGPQSRFSAFVADHRGIVLGMVTFNERYVTGWSGPTFTVQDIFVEPSHRNRGIGRALLAKVAAHARERNSPIIELVVREDNPARRFYGRTGFQPVSQCLTYVLAGPALSDLAETSIDWLALLG
jgi:ribosomal protein S18 acetylase RimI-like enzyme